MELGKCPSAGWAELGKDLTNGAHTVWLTAPSRRGEVCRVSANGHSQRFESYFFFKEVQKVTTWCKQPQNKKKCRSVYQVSRVGSWQTLNLGGHTKCHVAPFAKCHTRQKSPTSVLKF